MLLLSVKPLVEMLKMEMLNQSQELCLIILKATCAKKEG